MNATSAPSRRDSNALAEARRIDGELRSLAQSEKKLQARMGVATFR